MIWSCPSTHGDLSIRPEHRPGLKLAPKMNAIADFVQDASRRRFAAWILRSDTNPWLRCRVVGTIPPLRHNDKDGHRVQNKNLETGKLPMQPVNGDG